MKKLLILCLVLSSFIQSGAQIVVNSYKFKAGPLVVDSLTTQPYDVWALHKVVRSYSGNAITVRRSSDNTEANIGFSGIDLNTAALLSFCASTSCYVKYVYGQKGLANLSQTANANQPRIVDNGTLEVIGSRPAIRFINANNTYMDLASIGTTTGSTYAVAVFKGGTVAANNGDIFGDVGTDGVDHFPFADGNVYQGFASGTRKNMGVISPALTLPTVMSILSENNNYVFSTNNTVRYTNTTTFISSINPGTHRIGGSARSTVFAWDGHVEFMAIFKAKPNTTDQNRIVRSVALYNSIAVN